MAELWPWLRIIFRQRRRLLVGALFILLTLLSGLGLLALSGWFIAATAVTGLLLAAGASASLNIYVPGGGIRLFAVTRTVGRYLDRLYNHDTVLRLLATLRVGLFRHLAATRQLNRQTIKSADWLSRLTSDLDAMDTLYLRLVAPTAFAVLITALLITVAWLAFAPGMALVLAGLLGASLVIATVGLYARNRTGGMAQVHQQNRLRSDLIDLVQGQAELVAAGVLQGRQAEVEHQALRYSDDQTRLEVRTGWHRSMATVLVNLAVVASLLLGIELYRAGAIAGPATVILPLALLSLVEVYGLLPDAFGRLGETQAAAQRLNQIMEASRDRQQQTVDDQPSNCTTGCLVSLTDIGVRHQHGTFALNGLSLDIREGEWLGVSGESGCGKSTLADLLAGQVEPDYGHIAWSRDDVQIAYLEQQTVLFDDTVRNNLVPDGRPLEDALLWRTLTLVGLDERVAHLPRQLDGRLGSFGSQLSGGEARRLTLARTLLRVADLVILDEPFTGLDSHTRDEVSVKVKQALTGRTVVVLAHDPEAMPPVERIVRLTPPQDV